MDAVRAICAAGHDSVQEPDAVALLEHFDPSEIVVVEARDGSSHFRHLEAAQLSDWLADYSIGELWEKNVLGGGPLS